MSSGQREKNRQVQKALRDNGDPITQAREIDHFAYFDTGETRNAFVEQCQRLGLKLGHTSDPSDTSAQFGVQLVHTEVPAGDRCDELTEELAVLAEKLGGDYDGWGTGVVAAPRPTGLGRLWSKLRH